MIQCSVHLKKCWCVDQSGHKIADAFNNHDGKHCKEPKGKLFCLVPSFDPFSPLSLSLFTSFSSNCYVTTFRGLVTRPSVYSLQEYTWLLVTQVIPLWISIFIMWNFFISRKFIIFILLNIVPQRRAFSMGTTRDEKYFHVSQIRNQSLHLVGLPRLVTPYPWYTPDWRGNGDSKVSYLEQNVITRLRSGALAIRSACFLHTKHHLHFFFHPQTC